MAQMTEPEHDTDPAPEAGAAEPEAWREPDLAAAPEASPGPVPAAEAEPDPAPAPEAARHLAAAACAVAGAMGPLPTRRMPERDPSAGLPRLIGRLIGRV
jgi:hypothetical protein